jgi:hypothetical protein
VPPFPESIVEPRRRPVGVNTTDGYVGPNGLMYVSDYSTGPHIFLKYKGRLSSAAVDACRDVPRDSIAFSTNL